MAPTRRELTRLALSARKLALLRVGRPVQLSHYGEEEAIAHWTVGLPPEQRVAVDIGAADGVEGSNTLPLFRAGWRGLAAELDGASFATLALVLARNERVGLARGAVTPETVVPLLQVHGIPREFGLLDLDIDGYDHFVLAALLEHYRPRVIVAEINEKIPPPLHFTVKWSPDYEYRGDHFYGQSLTALDALAQRHGYALAELRYNNAFLIAAEHHDGPSLSAEDAYRQGYAEQADRLERFPWNRDVEPLQQLDPQAAQAWVDDYFSARRGEFELSL